VRTRVSSFSVAQSAFPPVFLAKSFVLRRKKKRLLIVLSSVFAKLILLIFLVKSLLIVFFFFFVVWNCFSSLFGFSSVSPKPPPAASFIVAESVTQCDSIRSALGDARAVGCRRSSCGAQNCNPRTKKRNRTSKGK
jgi:hypothetical protein